jgi:hypothetical protein
MKKYGLEIFLTAVFVVATSVVAYFTCRAANPNGIIGGAVFSYLFLVVVMALMFACGQKYERGVLGSLPDFKEGVFATFQKCKVYRLTWRIKGADEKVTYISKGLMKGFPKKGTCWIEDCDVRLKGE